MSDTHQQLMDQAYERWQTNRTSWSKQKFWDQLSDKERVAVFTGNLSSQVYNGGFIQWYWNGYSKSGEELLEILPHIGPTGKLVARILADVMQEIDNTEKWNSQNHYRTEEYYDEDEDEWLEEEVAEEPEEPDLEKEYDKQYWEIDTKFMEEVEAFLNLPDDEFARRLTGPEEKDEDIVGSFAKPVDFTKPTKRPVVIGPVDGNIFSVLGAAQGALRKAKREDEAKKMVDRATKSGSYNEALAICTEYVDFRL